jgi:hypothetical protein
MNNTIYYTPFSTINNSYFKTDFKPKSNLKFYINLKQILRKEKSHTNIKQKINNSYKSFLKTVNTGETNSTASENNIHLNKYLFNKLPKISNETLFKKSINKSKILIPKIIDNIKNNKKKEKDDIENDFMKYYKNHSYTTQRTRFKVNLINFTNEKRLKVLESRRKLFQHISKDVEEIKNRTKLIKVITNYISPYVEKNKNAKLKMLKKTKEKKLKLNQQNSKSEKNFLKSNENSPRNYLKIISLCKVKRNNSDIGFQKSKIKIDRKV